MARVRYPDSFIVSFWQRLQPELPPEHVRASVKGPCLVWTGALSREGHGKMSVGGQTMYAHRVAFEIAYEREPEGLLRHLCGVAACCNAQHLREGTDAQNLADQMAHGTYSPPPHPCGSDHPESKLSDADMAHLWTMHEHGYTQQEIADALKVSQSLVSQILTGKTRTCTP